jgi:hypothetical protein
VIMVSIVLKAFVMRYRHQIIYGGLLLALGPKDCGAKITVKFTMHLNMATCVRSQVEARRTACF